MAARGRGANEAVHDGLLATWNATDALFPQVAPAALVRAQVARTPHRPAVTFGPFTVTFAELDHRASRLARRLTVLGVGPGVLVGVHLERSIEMVVALLAVNYAGGAYVPLDPDFPADRLAFMLADCAAPVLLTHTHLSDAVPLRPGAEVVCVDRDHSDVTEPAADLAPAASGPDDLAYVLYTSGSTGRPKGVEITNRGLVNLLTAMADRPGLAPTDVLVAVTTISFDIAGVELWLPLITGAHVVVASRRAAADPQELSGLLDGVGATVMQATPATWRMMVEAGWPGRTGMKVLCGGEALPVELANRLLDLGVELWNLYGPTETTIWSTTLQVQTRGQRITIGRPLANTTLYILDPDMELMGVGEVGELHIGGAGLARGYRGRPELTAERFVPHPFDPTPGARVYKTGDLARWRPDGEVEYLGRLDNQVKVRGFRIECGEVEAALEAHPAVRSAVVVAREDVPGDTRLVAYVVPDEEVPASQPARALGTELRSMLRASLPDYMVPSMFVALEAWPLTPNGKVDRRALPAPHADPPAAAHSGLAPRSPTEAAVARIWAGVLGLDEATLRVDDDFFGLGGHSLLATQVIAQVREEFGTETPLRVLFETPTLAGLAAAVAAESSPGPDDTVLTAMPRQPGARLPLSIAQEQMWALETRADPQGLYNVTLVERFDRPVDEHALRDALIHITDRHEILRTCFPVDVGTPYQSVASTADVELRVTDLGAEPAEQREPELQRRMALENAEPFQLTRGPLFRAHLFRLGDASSRLTVTFDHVICDGPSTTVFAGELRQAYEAIVGGRVPDLPPLAIQFADFCVWQRAHVTPEVLRRQLDWWVRTLRGMRLGPAVPFDHMPASPTRRIASRAVRVAAGTRRLLDDVARDTHSTVFTVVAAAVEALCHRYAGTTDVVFSTTLSGRNRAELEPLIGTFAGIGRIRAELSGDLPFTEAVTRTREVVVGMFDNQDIPFMRVRRELLPDFPAGGLALAEVLPTEFQYFRTDPDKPDPELVIRGQLHPLSFSFLDDGREITGELSYKLDFYDAATIDALADGLENLLAAVAEDPTQPVSELPVASAGGRRSVAEVRTG